MKKESSSVGHEKLILSVDGSPRQALASAIEDVARYAVRRGQGRDVHLGVHEFRKSLRRLRTVARWLEDSRPDLNWLDVRTRLRSAFLLTNPLRDAHVLDEIADAVEIRAVAQPEWGELPPDWRQCIGRPAHAPEDGFVAPVLARAVGELPDIVHDFLQKIPSDLSVKELQRGLKVAYRRTRKTRKRASGSTEFEAVHDFRKRVKELRYILEAVASANPQAEPILDEMADLAKTLGRATDLELLLGHIVPDAPCIPVIQGQLDEALERAFQGSERFFEPSSSEFSRAVMGVLSGKLEWV